jgi:hypothetical protein
VFTEVLRSKVGGTWFQEKFEFLVVQITGFHESNPERGIRN